MNAPIRHRTNRVTPTQLKELRLLRVAVLHPDDTDGRQLTQQLQRIGCQVQAFWPPVPALPEGIDVVFLAVQPEISQMEFDWTKTENSPTCIAVVNYENPTIVDTVLRLGAKAVLPSPVRSFGLLSALVIARTLNDEIQGQARRIRKLEAKLNGARCIAEAKSILMRTRNVTELQAYDLIREQAYDLIREQTMSKRMTTEDIAAAIVNANEILSIGVKPRTGG